MEGKYGRLRRVTESIVVCEGPWDDDEPLFLVRSQDKLAPFFLMLYATLAGILGLQTIVAGVWAQRQAVLDWQAAHPERVKLPD
jgi:hypothetical protein